MHEKRLASFAYQMIFTPVMQRFEAGSVRVYIDPDKTMIPIGAGSRTHAERTRGVFIDLEAGREPYRFDLQVDDESKPAVLEVADVYAWITARAYSSSGEQRT